MSSFDSLWEEIIFLEKMSKVTVVIDWRITIWSWLSKLHILKDKWDCAVSNRQPLKIIYSQGLCLSAKDIKINIWTTRPHNPNPNPHNTSSPGLIVEPWWSICQTTPLLRSVTIPKTFTGSKVFISIHLYLKYQLITHISKHHPLELVCTQPFSKPTLAQQILHMPRVSQEDRYQSHISGLKMQAETGYLSSAFSVETERGCGNDLLRSSVFVQIQPTGSKMSISGFKKCW